MTRGLASETARDLASSPAAARPMRTGRAAARLRALGLLASLALGIVAPALRAAGDGGPAVTPGKAALQELRTFATTGRVLHIGAHPDDENTQLIAYLSRGRGYDTAYLSITRGDGGQNLLGPQFGEKLGVARTQELLAARRIDGGRQFFTRAIDFGFSKSPDETLAIWGHREVLGDVVRIIRRFRPDVIVTRFPIPPGSGGHGHHTASAMLAVEAFKLAGDPQAYPEQLREGLTPWQAKRIVWNYSSWARGGGLENGPKITVDIGGDDPVTGEPFGTIAARSRAMHKTQAFGGFSGSGGSHPESFVLLGGSPAEKDLMDGVDTTWSREPGGVEIGRAAAEAVAAFDVKHPEASVRALLALRAALARLPVDTIVADKRRELDGVLEACLGIHAAAIADRPEVVPGESMSVTAELGAAVPVQLVRLQGGGTRLALDVATTATRGVNQVIKYAVPTDTALTNPYWLRLPPAAGHYEITDDALIGLPVAPPELPVTFTLRVGDQELDVAVPVTHRGDGVESWAAGRVVSVVPPVSLSFGGESLLFRPGETREVAVTLTPARAAVEGTLRLFAPDGWQVSAPQPFHAGAAGISTQVTFKVTAASEPGTGSLAAAAAVGGRTWDRDRADIAYAHIPSQRLQPPAAIKIAGANVAIRGRTVAYVAGAGDQIPDALRQLGYAVRTLRPNELTPAALADVQAVVLGVRAFNTQPELAAAMPALFSFAQQGGVVVCQYNWSRGLKVEPVAPFPLTIGDGRVTDETAEVTLLAPEHPALNVPNKITSADFEGWVQERGVNFPKTWDPAFVPLLSMHDPEEAPQTGSLLVARYGKGYWVYTSLVFFRELPAGVPGAYRLFANLVSLGQ